MAAQSPRAQAFARDARVGGAIAAGGAIGAIARWAIEREWPAAPGGFPTATFAINVVGCAAIGVLMVLLEEVLRGRVYVRPLVGVGFLGGFTTFSAFAVETRALVGNHPAVALLYFIGTPTVAVLAAILGASVATWATGPRVSSPA